MGVGTIISILSIRAYIVGIGVLTEQLKSEIDRAEFEISMIKLTLSRMLDEKERYSNDTQ
jgi:hypothetical protein